jgi:glycosyltransferase involved in cell wall biosynthesis
MSFPRVAILCPELASNALGRCLLLARLLPPEARVEIIGLMSKPGVWAPARASGVPIDGIHVGHTRQLPAARRWLRSRVRADLLLVSKPLPTSLGLALCSGLRGVRLALDIDDWEYGLSLPHDGSDPHPLWRAGAALYGALRRGQPNSVLATRLCQPLARRVPWRLVSNRWLERRFGGTLLYHVRDESELDPARVAAAELRQSLDLAGRLWVGFVGTVRPHKGLEDLVGALGQLRGPRAPGLLLLGADAGDPVVGEVVARARQVLGPERLRVRHQFPVQRLAQHVQLVDVVAIPSRDTVASRGQLPAKLFDAMAMAKPVVATAVNEVAEVLGESGIAVPPGDRGAMADAIARLEDPALRRNLGEAARQRFLERYSFSVGRGIVREFVARAVA